MGAIKKQLVKGCLSNDGFLPTALLIRNAHIKQAFNISLHNHAQY